MHRKIKENKRKRICVLFSFHTKHVKRKIEPQSPTAPTHPRAVLLDFAPAQCIQATGTRHRKNTLVHTHTHTHTHTHINTSSQSCSSSLIPKHSHAPKLDRVGGLGGEKLLHVAGILCLRLRPLQRAVRIELVLLGNVLGDAVALVRGNCRR